MLAKCGETALAPRPLVNYNGPIKLERYLACAQKKATTVMTSRECMATYRVAKAVGQQPPCRVRASAENVSAPAVLRERQARCNGVHSETGGTYHPWSLKANDSTEKHQFLSISATIFVY